MKFFNWVHKRFHHHHPIHKDDEFAQKLEKTACVGGAKPSSEEMVQNITNDKDTQALLRKAVLVDALDGWKDGILAIGTFGFDPLKPFNSSTAANPKEYLVLESEEDGEEAELTPDFSLEGSDDDDDDSEDDSDFDATSEDEEANPLMFSSLGHSFNDEDIAIMSSNMEEHGDEADQGKKKAGRTTLADLFLADAEVKMKLDCSGKAFTGDEFGNANKKHNVRTKKTLSFAKKLIPKVKEETSPIKNIQRLMRRMLKRKIHPELLDLKSQKSDGQMAAEAIELVANGAEKSASESVSLLAMCHS